MNMKALFYKSSLLVVLVLLLFGVLAAQPNRVKLGIEFQRQPTWRSMIKVSAAYERDLLPRLSCELSFFLATRVDDYFYRTRQIQFGIRLNPRYYVLKDKNSCSGLFLGPTLQAEQLQVNYTPGKIKLHTYTYMGAGIAIGLQALVFKRISIQNQFGLSKRFYGKARSFHDLISFMAPQTSGLFAHAMLTIGYSIGNK